MQFLSPGPGNSSVLKVPSRIILVWEQFLLWFSSACPSSSSALGGWGRRPWSTACCKPSPSRPGDWAGWAPRHQVDRRNPVMKRINTMILKILECPHQTNSWSSLLQGAAFPGPLNDWSIEAEARKQTLDQRNFSYQVDSSAFRMSFEPAVASLLLLICNIWTRLASGFAGQIFLFFINSGVALAPLLSWFLPFLSKWLNWNEHHHFQTIFDKCLCSSWD